MNHGISCFQAPFLVISIYSPKFWYCSPQVYPGKDSARGKKLGCRPLPPAMAMMRDLVMSEKQAAKGSKNVEPSYVYIHIYIRVYIYMYIYIYVYIYIYIYIWRKHHRTTTLVKHISIFSGGCWSKKPKNPW